MKIELTDAEALVLSDWLYRNSKQELFFDDLAERYVFWNMECQLEKQLTDISIPIQYRIIITRE